MSAPQGVTPTAGLAIATINCSASRKHRSPVEEDRSSMSNVLRLHLDDNVVTAVRDLAVGDPVEISDGQLSPSVSTTQAIPFGHKVAIAPIACGQHVIKYGASIGVATQDIAPGSHVHSHNLRSVRGSAS